MAAALAHGGPVDLELRGMTVDSLGARRLGTIANSILSGADVVVASVAEDAIHKAQAALWETYRLAVEPGAAVPLAVPHVR